MQFFPGTATGVFPQGEDANYIAMGPSALQNNTMLASTSHANTLTGLTGGGISTASVASRFNGTATGTVMPTVAGTVYKPQTLALAA